MLALNNLINLQINAVSKHVIVFNGKNIILCNNYRTMSLHRHGYIYIVFYLYIFIYEVTAYFCVLSQTI